MGLPRWILVGIVVSAGCGNKSPDSAPSSSGSAAPGRAAIAARAPSLPAGSAEPPSLPEPTVIAPVPAAPSSAPSQEFETQTRDPAWAGATETEIRKRITKLGARIDTTECRHDRCLVTLRGTPDAMSDALAGLESSAGLQGFAQSIYLTAPVEQDGMLVVRAYATFDR